MTHTPTPWFNAGLSDKSTHYIIRELDDGRTIATARVFNGTESEANAAFIVRAVNAHDSFVEALEAINNMACYATEEDVANREHWLLKIGAIARANLAKVQPTNGYTRTPQQEQELDVMRSRGEI